MIEDSIPSEQQPLDPELPGPEPGPDEIPEDENSAFAEMQSRLDSMQRRIEGFEDESDIGSGEFRPSYTSDFDQILNGPVIVGGEGVIVDDTPGGVGIQLSDQYDEPPTLLVDDGTSENPKVLESSGASANTDTWDIEIDALGSTQSPHSEGSPCATDGVEWVAFRLYWSGTEGDSVYQFIRTPTYDSAGRLVAVSAEEMSEAFDTAACE
jgi:hypothetical protein